MLINRIAPLRYFAVIMTLLLASCGYDSAFQFETVSSASFRLTIVSDTPEQASSAIKQAFIDEGLALTLFADHGIVESYYISHSSSQISITIYRRNDFRRVVVAIYPARLAPYSASRRKGLKEREQALLRIKQVLEQSDSFAEYVVQK
ncbi:MAG: hypothetical protein COB92_00340 [Robiginitomaculum sp.]|nr:MAG: hypothetical protein COB92_00340 [Robiginitomaculum sp.]